MGRGDEATGWRQAALVLVALSSKECWRGTASKRELLEGEVSEDEVESGRGPERRLSLCGHNLRLQLIVR